MANLPLTPEPPAIDWTPPPPRPGLIGQWDSFIGPGATPAELTLIILAALAGGLLVPLYALGQQLGWTPWQLAVGALLGADLAGGVATNATTAAQRWYHRPGQGLRAHLGFTAVHFIHPLLVAWLFRAGDWVYFAAAYGYLLGASLLLLALPLYLQRSASLLLYLGGLLMSLYLVPATPGLEWFLPVFYLKLLVSHLVREAPFRPGA